MHGMANDMYYELLNKLISSGISMNQNMGFPKTYRYSRHRGLIKSMYSVVLDRLQKAHGTCGVIHSCILLKVMLGSCVKGSILKFDGGSIILEFSILEELIEERYCSHPVYLNLTGSSNE